MHLVLILLSLFILLLHSPWTDSYETCEQNLYTEPVRAFLMSRMEQLKSEEVVYTQEEYTNSVVRPHPQCVLAEVTHKRKGVLLQVSVPQGGGKEWGGVKSGEG